MSISSEFRDDWDLFNNYAKEKEMTTSDLLMDLVKKHVDGYSEEGGEDFDESALLAELTGTSESDTASEKEMDSASTSKKVKVKKPAAPKKKSFVARKTTVTKKREVSNEDEELTIQNTPKFRLLELVRKLDVGDGINPDSLVSMAEEEGIPNPRLQMNKMIRRGILYVHLDRIHVT